VQASAGTLAVTSAFPVLTDWKVGITVAVIAVLFYGNMRGTVRPAGRSLCPPTSSS